MKTIKPPKLTTPGKIDIARATLANDLPQLAKLIAAIPGDPVKVNTTKYFATRFLAWFKDQSGPTPFSVFAAAGNMKLPFYAFSSLPGFDCPGAGACLYGENKFTRKTSGKAGVILLPVGDIRRRFSVNCRIVFCYGPKRAGQSLQVNLRVYRRAVPFAYMLMVTLPIWQFCDFGWMNAKRGKT